MFELVLTEHASFYDILDRKVVYLWKYMDSTKIKTDHITLKSH